MSGQDMLGRVMRKLVELPPSKIGLVCDFCEKLGSKEGEEWVKRFLRKEENIFRIVCEGNRTVTELVRLGRYDWSNDLITEEHFPLGKHESEERTIELVKLDYDPSSEDVLREFDRRGLARPQAEDALYFGILCPKEQRKYPLVFLHEPVFGPGGGCRVLVLGGGVSGRHLLLGWFDYQWPRHFAFAGIRKQHSCLGS